MQKLSRFISTFLVLLSSLFSLSQSDSDSIAPNKTSKYLNFLLKQDSTTPRYFTISARYLYTVLSPSFKSKGAYLNLGLNIGRLFSKKIFIGPTADVKLIPGLNAQRFSDKFKSDFNQSFNSYYGSPEDSILAFKFKDEISDDRIAFSHGNNFGNIGLTFSIFPEKFAGIFVSLKTGVKSFRTSGGAWQPLPNNVKEHYWFYWEKNYSIELSLKPHIFENRSFLIISLFYERLDLNNAAYEDLKLSSMVNDSFMKKYGLANTFGLSFGYGFK